MGMQVQVVTVVRNKGVGRESHRAYDFQVIGGLITTARGTEFAEFMLDGDQPVPEAGKRYEAELSFYPDAKKKLTLKVVTLRPVVAAAASRAA